MTTRDKILQYAEARGWTSETLDTWILILRRRGSTVYVDFTVSGTIRKVYIFPAHSIRTRLRGGYPAVIIWLERQGA